jgi:ATP-dependent RNA helicase SUPV3L1/SUV3
MGFDVETRIRNVTAVLGPTNTGKTHLAIERMLGHETGMIGLPLRLLAREVYDRIVARVGVGRVALITGEEKIRPEGARYWVSTVEAMPRDIDVDFLAIDEIQLAADPERGHVFTDRLLHARGKLETLLLGAHTMRDCIADLIPGANFISRPRLSKLVYSGQKKITRLPSRTAVVAFSSSEVYQIAELIRRQQGGAAVVMGAQSPRTRNAQVALYQSGDVDYLVATDAIGMGLNLDVNHVAFASTRKFDGYNFRQLTPAELAQIAGRAGRHLNDGTFGVTGDVEPFDQDIVDRLENHNFEPLRMLQWRARNLDFTSVHGLKESLRQLPNEQRLVRARMADDVEALENVSSDREVTELVRGPASVSLLWEVCQIPDYRKISSQNHAELVSTVFKYLRGPEERIPEDWFSKQVEFSDRTDGDIDTLSTRIAHIRTWTFVANRQNWLKDHAHWQGRTREIEDSLSDALHEQLTQRFVDRRTSALMKGLRAKEELSADIGDDGGIVVEGHFVGRLKGFRFIPDTSQTDGIHGKAARNAAAQVLAKELGMRVRRVASAKNDAFKLTRNGRIIWRDQEIARLEPAEDGLKPQVVVIADEYLVAPERDKVQERLNTWIAETIAEKAQSLVEISKAEDIQGLARGIAFRLVENFGTLKRDAVGDELKTLDQPARAQLRKYGVRFGAFNIFFPQLMKPGPAELTLSLWILKHGAASGLDPDALPDPPRPGLTSVPANPKIPEGFYRACGYHVCGPRAVRMDIIERLADMIRPMIAFRGKENFPRGATGDGGFLVVPEMLSILGCSGDELGLVLKSLGFWLERRPKRKPVPVAPVAVVAASDLTAAAAVEVAGVDNGAIAAAAGEGSAVDADVAVDPVAGEAASVSGEVGSEAPATGVVAQVPEVASAPAEVAAEEAGAGEPVATEADVVAGGDEATTAPATTEAVPVEMEDVWRPRRHRREERHGQSPGDRQDQRRRGGRNQSGRGDQRQGEPRTAESTSGDQRPGAPNRGGQNRGGPNRGGQNRAGARGDRYRQDRKPDGTPSAVDPALAAGATGTEGVTPEGVRADLKQGEPRRDRDGDRRHGGGREGDRQGGRPQQGTGPSHAQGKPHHGKPAHGGGGRDRDQRDRGDNRGRDQRDRNQGQGQGRAANTWQSKGAPPAKQKQADPDSPFAKLSALKAELEKRTQGSS